ncbi:ABC transporter permease [Streptomyces bauhiniae]|uniref:ABC transporter permease n=1 Tax=Streptomyces bauhiniae TaxID=2340725 RepID=UPI0035D54AC0
MRQTGQVRHRSVRAKWHDFRGSPFYPATVVAVLLALGVAGFAGSYTYAMAAPIPRSVPTAVVGRGDSTAGGRAFVDGMEQELRSSLRLHRFPTLGAAEQSVDKQESFAVLDPGDGRSVTLYIASAAGASVSELFVQSASRVGERLRVTVTVHDLKPLAKGDPRGLALFYISIATVIIGFIGAIQLTVHAAPLNPGERIAFTALYSGLGGLAIQAVVSWWLHAVPLPFPLSWLIISLTMFTSGMVFTMFNTLVGRWSIIPTWGLMVLLGNPSSGGAVSWPLLPQPLGLIGRWLPPGASVNALHTAVYFPEYELLQPYLVLTGWALLSCGVFWIWRHRHPGGRPKTPQPVRD